MSRRKIVLHPQTGNLSAVVESYQDIEIAQLEAEVNEKQATVNRLQSELEVLSAELDEAKAALEDSKSELEMGSGLVEQPTDDTSTDGVDIPVAYSPAQPDAQF